MTRVGCSGWQYRHWRGDFYPERLAVARWLDQYAATFDTVELNNSFYRLPERTAFERWRARTPPGFLFAVKASRFLTHLKKLKDPDEPLSRFFERAVGLESKLGPVLYQLPPGWTVDRDRLDAFLRALPSGFTHVMEFRDASWYAPEVLARLDAAGVSLCLHDMAGSASGRLRVGPVVYVRFHGTIRYGGAYPTDALEDWARWLNGERSAGRDVFCYFNNDIGGHAPRDAERLKQLIC